MMSTLTALAAQFALTEEGAAGTMKGELNLVRLAVMKHPTSKVLVGVISFGQAGAVETNLRHNLG